MCFSRILTILFRTSAWMVISTPDFSFGYILMPNGHALDKKYVVMKQVLIGLNT